MNAVKPGLALVLMLGMLAAQAQNSSAGPAAAPEALRSVALASAAPPPTIADLVLLLQSYKPDAERIASIRTAMDAAVTASADPAQLAIAWHTKALAAGELHEVERRGEFLARALEYARLAKAANPAALGSYQRIRFEYADTLAATAGVTAALDSFSDFLAEIEKGRSSGLLIQVYCRMSGYYLQLGDMERAKALHGKAEAIYGQLARRPRAELGLPSWSRQIEAVRGAIFRREGRIDDEERAFLESVRHAEAHVAMQDARRDAGVWVPPASRPEEGSDARRINLAQTLTAQARLDEAELLLREVLKRSLERDGRNSLMAGHALAALRSVFTSRGRHAEALVIAEWAEKALVEAGISERSAVRVNSRIGLVNALGAVGRHREAAALIDDIRSKLTDDSRLEEAFAKGTLGSMRSFIEVGRIADALRDGEHLLAKATRNFGADHYYTAEVRAVRAMALRRADRVDEARKEFQRAVAVLTDPARVVGKQKISVGRATRLRYILNEYLAVLVGGKGRRSETDVAEAFRVADVARWQSVQKAVTGSALRAAAGSPQLGARIKKLQDADDELEAAYGILISQRSAPPDRQQPAAIAAVEGRIAALKKEQQRDLAEIRRQFPQYDALVSPRPADLATARKALLANEALLSIYVTPGGSYVWGTARDGALRFHYSRRSAAWLAGMVRRVRDSVDFSGGDGPAQMGFDLAAAAALYRELLAPVQGAWGSSDTLLVVANEPLGQIPFSLLPTTDGAPAGEAAGLPLSQWRQTPWLARKLAVAYVPSISALVTLRALPQSKGRRDPFIGFGDPDFGAYAGKAAPGPRGTRNLGISHAPKWDENATGVDAIPTASAIERGTPLLVPLPDTRDEILAIAAALAADVRRDTFFGDRASRRNVFESDLKSRRVLAFATHGLVPGDLPGLDQPALALAPEPGRSIHDGLLKLEDILKLLLDADLVVLSACNTAAAEGSGAEAVSGLGRGFFHAGARAVLATHWPVETVSARELVTRLFDRYARESRLTRAKALQQAMLELIDTGVALDERGKPEYSYAHPVFWAPYALYGDPGR